MSNYDHTLTFNINSAKITQLQTCIYFPAISAILHQKIVSAEPASDFGSNQTCGSAYPRKWFDQKKRLWFKTLS